jgi:predicted metal-binding membrane protein
MTAHVTMWFGMMAAMMVPTAWPWLRAFHRFHDKAIATVEFAGGYLIAWLFYALAAATFHLQVGAPSDFWKSAIFIVAGLYQFSPMKQACLSHCRTPFTFFLTRWHDGPSRGFRIGLNHGLFCVGCCWALMATSFAVGMTNLGWMVALAAVTFIEQVVPHGHRLRLPLGIALLVAAFGLV